MNNIVSETNCTRKKLNSRDPEKTGDELCFLFRMPNVLFEAKTNQIRIQMKETPCG